LARRTAVRTDAVERRDVPFVGRIWALVKSQDARIDVGRISVGGSTSRRSAADGCCTSAPPRSYLIRTCLRFRRERATREAVLPGVGSTPNLDGGGFYPNKDVTITESGPGRLIPARRRISEDWFPHGPGHETLLPITSAFREPVGATMGPVGPKVSAPVRNWPIASPYLFHALNN
jgi:hypothetical protein